PELSGHKDLVFAVAWSHDGELFASGSLDRSVILWTEQHEGTLKYSHSDAIQCLAFSPVTSLLLSCAVGDFGVWSADEKNVQKQRISGRCASCAWSRDGRQQEGRIRCHDLVKKVAIYGHKLAVQLSDRLHIYRQIKGDGENEQLEYTLSERINKAFDCSLLVIGGPPGRETILIGLREGQVCKLFVDNPFPVQVLKLNGPIKCIDISATRKHIAVVDDSGLCVVFDAKTKEVLFEEPNCNSVAFNSDNEEIICYSGSSKLTVRARGYPGHQQRLFVSSRLHKPQISVARKWVELPK
ncbi:hypothetical protein GCK32_013616, partial [Trichostrongylus colubriformis]